MGKALIIVESPAKIKTLKKFLGPNYLFESSIGHIRDLPQREFGIDIDHDFEPKYVIMPDKEEVIDKLIRAAKKCDVVYLSPDPDREGEAIAWHISQILPKNTITKRVSFNSITKDAVLKALDHPRSIDMALVNAQQARRLLDRIVGYKISPLLNRRIQRGKESSLSAGRVQSVALLLVVDREKEITAFTPVEYWNISAMLQAGSGEKAFRASLYSVDGKRVEKEAIAGKELCLISNKEKAEEISSRIKKGPFFITRLEKKEKKRYPVPPFITSTLQQEASRHYGFSAARTMSIAQGLYEGVNLGSDGPEGLITYMRTDSIRVEPVAIEEVRAFILKHYGQEFLPATPKIYSTKKSAQDAHEAIRPANPRYLPEEIQSYLSREQFLLYQLIWRRFVASQMTAAIYDTVSADITVNDTIIMRATGSVIKFQGFLAVYEEKHDEEEKNEENHLLPPLQQEQEVVLQKLFCEQAFTKAPPRYSEASLVKELEKSGIGRPSTYATIMNKIQSREYTIKENGRLKPTELGQVIAQMLAASFPQIMNSGFTAKMEDDLEEIADDKKNWKALIQEFWHQFSPTLELALKEAFVPKVPTDIVCPKCNQGNLQKIWARSKYFYGCERYPECDYSAPIEEVAFNKEEYATNFDWQQPCPLCGNEMKVRHGKYGAFLGCERYPECKGLVNIPKKGEEVLEQKEMPPCPAINCPGHLVAKKSRFGKIFYSCSTFPECNVIVNDLEQLTTKYAHHERTPYQKKEKKGAKKTKVVKEKPAKKNSSSSSKKVVKKEVKKRTMPTYALSKPLAKLLGAEQLSRGEVTKQIWEYIKKNKLQDTQNKRLIHPDEALAEIFGSKEAVDMFKMAGLISPHLT